MHFCGSYFSATYLVLFLNIHATLDLNLKAIILSSVDSNGRLMNVVGVEFLLRNVKL